jgi:hypothetical protein
MFQGDHQHLVAIVDEALGLAAVLVPLVEPVLNA